MDLLVDIGNTSIGVMFSENNSHIEKFNLACRKDKVSDEYSSIFRHLFKNHLNDNVEYICISSVVPSLTLVVKSALTRLYKNAKTIIVKSGVKTGVLFKIDNMSELGADLVCDTVAMKKKYCSSVVAVDLGTATKFLLLDKDGVFQGCSIAPGIAQAVNSLTNAASLLPEIDLTLPKGIIGKNTFESIKSGSILGHAIMIKGMCEAYEKEVGYPLKKIITGGYSLALKDYFISNGFIIDENLVFEGLSVICEKNK